MNQAVKVALKCISWDLSRPFTVTFLVAVILVFAFGLLEVGCWN